MTTTYRQALLLTVCAALLSACGCTDNAKVIARQQRYVLDVTRPPAPPATAEATAI